MLRFSAVPDQAQKNYFRLGYFTKYNRISGPAPVDECRNFLNWINSKEKNHIETYNLENYGNKNRDLWGKDGVAWVSMDKAGKTYEWKGNNSLTTYQAYDGSKLGNQLNIWQDSKYLNPNNGVGITNDTLYVLASTFATPTDVKVIGDAKRLTTASKYTFQFLRNTGNTPVSTVNISYQESNTSTTSLTSSITNTSENQQKASVALKINAGYSPGKDVKGWGGGVEVTKAWEGIWKETKQVSTSSTSTDASTKGVNLSIAFSPSVISTQTDIYVPEVNKTFRLTEGKVYVAYISVNQSNVSTSVGGSVTYYGKPGVLPLNSSLFGSYDDTYTNLSSSPGLGNATLADYISIANGTGNAVKLFDLAKVKITEDNVVKDVDQLVVAGSSVITNLGWNSDSNLQTNITFLIDEYTSPAALVSSEYLTSSSQELRSTNENNIYNDAYLLFQATHDDFVNDPSRERYSISSSSNLTAAKSAQFIANASLNNIFVKPINQIDSSALSTQDNVGQQMQLDNEHANAIGILQKNLTINGSQVSNTIMVSSGNSVNTEEGDDLIILYNPQFNINRDNFVVDLDYHSPSQSNAEVAYLNGGNGNDTFVTDGSTSIITGDDTTAGDDVVKAKGRVTFYSGQGFDNLVIQDFADTKYFVDFDTLSDSIIIEQSLYDANKSNLKVKYDQISRIFEFYNKDDIVLSVKLANQASFSIDATGNISKADILSYLLRRLDGAVLGTKEATQILMDFQDSNVSGNQFLVSILQSSYRPSLSYSERSPFLEKYNAPFVSRDPNFSDKGNLSGLVVAAPLLKSTLNPFLKAISPKLMSIDEIDSKKLGSIISIYEDTFRFKLDEIKALREFWGTAGLNSKIAESFISTLIDNNLFDCIPIKNQSGSALVRKLVDPLTGSMFLSNSQEEVDFLVGNKVFDEILTYGKISSNDSQSIIYRLYNESSADHLFTSSQLEKDLLLSLPTESWRLESELNAYTQSVPGSSSVYRYYNPTLAKHYFIPLDNASSLIPVGSVFEGFAFAV